MTGAAQPPPGWYPDPTGIPRQAYWDGQQWQNVTPPPPRERFLSQRGLLITGGVLSAVILISLLPTLGRQLTHMTEPQAALMNADVHDGKFSFRVIHASRSNALASDMSTPRGEFFVVTMNVSNVGDQPQSFFVNNQKLIDANGRQYAADTMAAIGINNGNSMVIDMNPGFTINVAVPFDVPRGANPTEIELHDSAFSHGVKVRLEE